jgi:hypothetical protein
MHLNNIVEEFFGKLQNKSLVDIKEILQIDNSLRAKNHLNNTIHLIINKHLIKSKESLKSYNIRVIRLNSRLAVEQSISFTHFKFQEIIHETWIESTFRNELVRPFLFFIFIGNDKNNPKFHKFLIWEFPKDVLDNDVKMVWEKTKSLISNGNIISHIDKRGRKITNFPSISETKTVHLRPHGRNSKDVDLLPVIDKRTSLLSLPKHCFWLNKHFIKRIIIDGIK